MGELTRTLIYWYVSIGLIVGLSSALIIGKEGVSFFSNIIFGVIGAVSMGLIGFVAGIGDGLFVSFIATWPFLFLVNVFHRHHVEEVLGETHDAEINYHHADKKDIKTGL